MPANHRYGVPTVFILLACTVLASCSSGPSSLSRGSTNPVSWVTPYKIDVIQGNFISSEQVGQLRPGQSRDEVKAVLGTPLMASVFHADRWDYVFTLNRQGLAPQSFKYTVYFKGDQLERFEGDAMPSEVEFIAKLDSKHKLGKVPVLEATEEQLKSAEKSSAAKPASGDGAANGTAGAAVMASYPPLESPKQ
ncbi:MAG: cell envelope protein SmpA [Burkholderiales bacterium RIFCSPHIGHO2_12_FULL_61_11]|nr:MAG: cell envelope protein SmpA [Burkholderiales bacterium RIFCSPHIGHO2_12_FULL_61_11]